MPLCTKISEWKTCFKRDRRSIDEKFLYTKHYCPTNGYSHYVWKEDNDSDQILTSHQEVIDRINKNLPEYSSSAYKIKVKQPKSLTMEDKKMESQFRNPFQELTGHKSLIKKKVCKCVDDKS